MLVMKRPFKGVIAIMAGQDVVCVDEEASDERIIEIATFIANYFKAGGEANESLGNQSRERQV